MSDPAAEGHQPQPEPSTAPAYPEQVRSTSSSLPTQPHPESLSSAYPPGPAPVMLGGGGAFPSPAGFHHDPTQLGGGQYGAYPTPDLGPATVIGPGFTAPQSQMSYHPGYGHPHPPVSKTLIYAGIEVPNPEAPPAPHGTSKVPGYFPEKDYEVLKGAKKGGGIMGSGWNEATLTKLLVGLNVFEMDALSDYFSAKMGRTLVDYLPSKGKLTGWFYEVVHALALGPLGYDVELAKRATTGVGTNESILIELLLNRSNGDIEILKRAYTKRWGSSLMEDVKGDVSKATKAMFNMALMAQRPVSLPGAHVDLNQVEKDVDDLNYNGASKNTMLDEVLFCQVFINRSDAHIAAVIDRFGQKYKSLSKIIKAHPDFSADVRRGLLYIIHGVKSKRNRQEPYGVWRDAKLLERSMAGMGTNDEALIYRVVRTHWNRARMEAIKEAYMRRYGKSLDRRVQKETSGSYKAILTELINKKPHDASWNRS